MSLVCFQAERKVEDSLPLVVFVDRLQDYNRLICFIFMILTIIQWSSQLYLTFIHFIIFFNNFYFDLSIVFFTLLSQIVFFTLLSQRMHPYLERLIIEMIFIGYGYLIKSIAFSFGAKS